MQLSRCWGSDRKGPHTCEYRALTSALNGFRDDLVVPEEEFCQRLARGDAVTVAGSADARRFAGWVERVERLGAAYRSIGERWASAGVASLVDAVVRDVEGLDTSMNVFLENLRAHEVALDLVAEIVRENGAPVLLDTTLRERWVLDFALRIEEEYGDIRDATELGAIVDGFEKELAGEHTSHLAWLGGFDEELRPALRRATAIVGAHTLRACEECTGASLGRSLGRGEVELTSVGRLRRTRDRLRREIDAARRAGCCDVAAPNLRSAIEGARASVEVAEARMHGDLSELTHEMAATLSDMNKILTNYRGVDITLFLGVYNRNTVVTYRLFAQEAPELYSIVPVSGIDLINVTEGLRDDGESRAATVVASGDGFRFVGEQIFEVHRTYQLAAFAGFAWTYNEREEYGVRRVLNGDGEEIYVAEEVGSAGARMLYVAGVKYYPWERDVFPGAGTHWWRRPALVFGLPMNERRSAVFGGSWEPRTGVDLMVGLHWQKQTRLREGTTAGVTPLEAAADGTYAVPLREGSEVGLFFGISLDQNIFSSLFGGVAAVGGSF